MESMSLPLLQLVISETRDRIDMIIRRTKSEPIIPTTIQKNADNGSRLRRVKSNLKERAKAYITRTFDSRARNTKTQKQATRRNENREGCSIKQKKRATKCKERKPEHERNGRECEAASEKKKKERSLSKLRASMEGKVQLFMERKRVGSDRTIESVDWKREKEARMMEMKYRKIWLTMCKEKEEQIKEDQYMRKMVERKDSGM
jgi:hypothetical protein